MRSIVEQNGTEWKVTIYGPGASLGDESSPEQISVMTLLFESSSGEVRYRTTGERPLETFSDNKLLEMLNKDDECEV